MRRKRAGMYVLAASAMAALPSVASAALASYSGLVAPAVNNHAVVYYQLDETSGTTATDSGLNGTNGTYGTGANITHETAAVSGSSPALVGSVRNTTIDTANPMVLTSLGTGANSPSSINTGSFSVEFWFKSLAVDDRQDMMDMNFGASGSGSDFGIHLIGNNGTSSSSTQLRVFHNAGTGGDVVPASVATTVSQNVWHYLVYTRDAANLNAATLYLDGNSFATGTDSQSLTSTTPTLALGQKTSGNTRAFVGNLDEFAIYNTALTPADVTAHYAAGVPEPTTLSLFGLAAAGLHVRRRRAQAL